MANGFDQGEETEEKISFNYLAGGLKVGLEEVEALKKRALLSLQNRKKLCLVLDLNHTLVHSVKLSTLSPEQKLVLSLCQGHDIFQWESLSGKKYVTKLRPFVKDFLEEASHLFHLYVYTLGSRDYASNIVHHFLDPQGIYFGNRVISREDCTVPYQKGLDVVLVDNSAVLVLDHSESVWKSNSENLIVIYKYNSFDEIWKREEGLRDALGVLRKIHSVYFQCYDRFKVGDVRVLILQTHWQRYVSDQESYVSDQEEQQQQQQEVAKSYLGGLRDELDDGYSSVTKKQRTWSWYFNSHSFKDWIMDFVHMKVE